MSRQVEERNKKKKHARTTNIRTELEQCRKHKMKFTKKSNVISNDDDVWVLSVQIDAIDSRIVRISAAFMLHRLELNNVFGYLVCCVCVRSLTTLMKQ